MSRTLVRLVLAAAVTASLAPAASAEPGGPGPYPCHLRFEPWIASDIDGVPNIGKPYFDCYY